MKQTKIQIPANRLVEIQINVTGSKKWNVHDFVNSHGEVNIGEKVNIIGARVKVVVTVHESRAKEVDPKTIREAVLAAGAAHCRTPEIRVIRTFETKRAAAHDPTLDLEKSIELFAKEINATDSEHKVKFATALAREADAK